VDRASKRFVGLLGEGPVPVRNGARLLDAAGAAAGTVTSGTVSPSLGRPVMLAYVHPGVADDAALNAVVRNQPHAVRIAPLPFVPKRYQR
jgi:aminomethyltransferase